MRKLGRWFIPFLVLIILILPSSIVFARAGGFHGGFGGGHYFGGHTSFRSSPDVFHGRWFLFWGPRFAIRDNGLLSFLAVLIVLLPAAYIFLRSERQKRLAESETNTLSDELQREFSTLFFQVEHAWSENDQQFLQRVFGSVFYQQQKGILDNYTSKNLVNRLDNISIISLRKVNTPYENQLKISVTGQMRDYFEHTDRDAKTNAKIRESATINRFTEVWEMHRELNGHLRVDTIRQK